MKPQKIETKPLTEMALGDIERIVKAKLCTLLKSNKVKDISVAFGVVRTSFKSDDIKVVEIKISPANGRDITLVVDQRHFVGIGHRGSLVTLEPKRWAGSAFVAHVEKLIKPPPPRLGFRETMEMAAAADRALAGRRT